MKTNSQLQADVQNAISWEPLLKQIKITVEAANGIVTISGIVNSYIKKSQAEEVTKKIIGVKGVIEKIAVKFNNEDEKTDAEIAVAALHVLKANQDVPYDRIQIEVENGHVTLNGILKWDSQRQVAQQVVSAISGIKMLTNHIEIKNDSPDDIEKADIEQAIVRNWALKNQVIAVDVSGNIVTLKGTVQSFYQKEEAERMAWSAPGVHTVTNQLFIEVLE